MCRTRDTLRDAFRANPESAKYEGLPQLMATYLKFVNAVWISHTTRFQGFAYGWMLWLIMNRMDTETKRGSKPVVKQTGKRIKSAGKTFTKKKQSGYFYDSSSIRDFFINNAFFAAFLGIPLGLSFVSCLSLLAD